MKKQFFVTRPSIATELIQRGYTYEVLPNPYNPNYRTWEFPLTIELAKDVEQLYTERDIAIPAVISNTLKGGMPE